MTNRQNSSSPEVSVVMSAFNEERTIIQSVDSVLAQKNVDLELILVDDGSTDATVSLVKECISDPRLVLIEQENQGLTRALITACNLSKAKFIARHDVGDKSHPERMHEQVLLLKKNPECALVSCTTEFRSELGETVFVVDQSKSESSNTMVSADKKIIGPPHHGSVMFRRSQYLTVGGYRAEFTVAQDIDLWSRLMEVGYHHSLPKPFYMATLQRGSISMLKRKQQLAMVSFITEGIEERARTGSDLVTLQKVQQYNQYQSAEVVSIEENSYDYFVGSNLLKEQPRASVKYFRSVLELHPLHLKARLKLVLALIKSKFTDLSN